MSDESVSDQSPTQGRAADLLWADLEGEGASFTFAAQFTDRWRLRHGSIIFGPESMLNSAWHDWHRRQQNSGADIDVWRIYGLESSEWVSFDHRMDSWRFVRFSLPRAQTNELLRRWFESGQISPPVGESLVAPIGLPSRQAMVPTSGNSPMSGLVAGVGRPLLGWMQPFQTPAGDEPMPSDWNLGPGRSQVNGAYYILGMRPSAPPVDGVFIGAVAHPAWLRGMRGTPADIGEFQVDIGLDPARIASWELVLDVEEADEDGHLLSAQQLRLADLKLPDHGSTNVRVSVNSVGGRLTRRVRLHDLSGRLLDAADDVHLLEQIVVDLRVIGTLVDDQGSRIRIRIGEPAAVVSAHEHLEALARNVSSLREAHEHGFPQRVNIGTAKLRSRLSAARGELRVVDRYFGKEQTDWDLLGSVRVPIRLVRSKYNAPPPPGLNAIVRQGDHHDFHDRYFLWDGGGFHLGASASALDSQASYLVTVLEPAVAAHMTERFEEWWISASPTEP